MSSVASTFKTHEPSLPELLDEIHKGTVQLPDFQRGWVWDDDRIRSLIASVSLSYPIGAVMVMETGGEGVRFKPRPVEGVVLPAPVEPQRLILDGQQRLTSLYMTLRSGRPVATRTATGKDVERVYFLDMARCLDPEADRLDAVVSLPPDRVLRSDFNRRIELDASTDEKAFEAGLFPLDILFDSTRSAAWRRAYGRHFRQNDARLDLWDEFEAQVVQRFHQYRIPIIELLQNTPKEAVCQVFEKVNTGGMALDVFELVTATFAADDFRLRDDWDARASRLTRHRQLKQIEASDFLAAVTLLASYRRNQAGRGAVSCKRKDLLKLSLGEYRAHADEVEAGFVATAKLLTRGKIFDAATLPYFSQLIPLAAICAVLGTRFEEDALKRRLSRWYWCGVFGELYGGSADSRYVMDIQDVLAWFDGGDEPRTVREADFNPTRLLSLQTRNSAAYKGFMSRLMVAGSRDFMSGDSIELTTYFETAVDIHHVFPKSHCAKQGYDWQRVNCVINKAPLSARTNRVISGHAPSAYLGSLEKNHKVAPENLDLILRSHRIEPELIRADDFDGFFRARARRLLDLIEDSTGKEVSGRDTEEVNATFGGPLTREGNAAGHANPLPTRG